MIRRTLRMAGTVAAAMLIFGRLSSLVIWSFAEKWYWPHLFPQQVGFLFAPTASVLLPYRVNQPTAEDLLFSGRSLNADEAKAAGLIQTVFDDPEAAALAYFEQHLASKSAASLACAVLAARAPMIADVRRRLAEVESLYRNRLMQTRDANEGLLAFLAKRKPNWEDR